MTGDGKSLLPTRVLFIKDALRQHLANLDEHPDIISLAILDIARERKLIPSTDDPVADPIEMLQIALRNCVGFLDEERLGQLLFDAGIGMLRRE